MPMNLIDLLNISAWNFMEQTFTIYVKIVIIFEVIVTYVIYI